MVSSEAMAFKPDWSTANNGITVLINTTQGFSSNEALSSTIVGPLRGMFRNRSLMVQHMVTAQNVTVKARKLVNGAWDEETTLQFPLTLTSGDATITANAEPQEPWTYQMPYDVVIWMLNGATGPTIHTGECTLLANMPRSGV